MAVLGSSGAAAPAVLPYQSAGPAIGQIQTGGMGGTGAYGPASPLNNPYGASDYAFMVKPQWNIQTPYDPMIASAKQYLYTPQQMRTIANQQATAQINAQLGSTNASYQQQLDYLAQMQNRSAGLAQALGSFGPQYASAIQDIYDKAAQTQSAVGSGVVQQGTDQMNQALGAAQQQVADKTGGQGQVQSYDPNALGATLQATGVGMPGNSLALGGANAAQLSLWGANADKAQAQTVVDYYTNQATQALQQRTAARSSIIAQQPQLFQQALEATRQDNYQTQNRIDNLVSSAQQYIMNRNQYALSRAQGLTEWQLAQMTATGINPSTGQPVKGMVWGDNSHTFVVPYNQLTQARHWQNQDINASNLNTIRDNYYQGRNAIAQQNADTKAFAGPVGTGKYDPRLSAALNKPVDSYGNALNVQGWKPPTTAAKPLSLSQRNALIAPMASYVDQLAKGVPANAKTGAAAVAPVSAEQAFQNLAARGWFNNPQQMQWASQALMSSYGLSGVQIQNMLSGYNPAGGSTSTNTMAGQGTTGVKGGDTYGPPAPTGTTSDGGNWLSQLSPSQRAAYNQLNPTQKAQVQRAMGGMNKSIGQTASDILSGVGTVAAPVWNFWNSVRHA